MPYLSKGVYSMILSYLCFLAVVPMFMEQAWAHAPPPTKTLSQRTYPYFPDYPPSCKICEKSYPDINSCCDASHVLENVTQIIFNPGGFVDVIQCSCTDTFQAAFPQCVDCFIMTNQTTVLQTNNLPSLVSGMREICSLFSVLMGGVASTNRQLPSQTPISIAEIQNSAVMSLENDAVIITAAWCMVLSALFILPHFWDLVT